MAFDTRTQLKTWLTNQLPTGVGGSGATNILNEAITDAVGYCGTWLRDTARDTFVGDGVTTRWALTGADCRLLDAPHQEAPTGVATAVTLTAPTAAPTATVLGSGGSIAAGVYYAAVAYTTTIGVVTCYTAPSPQTSAIVVPVGSNRITLAWTGPSTATDPGVGTQTYLSTGSGVADIRASSTTSGSTATVTISSLPATSAARPLKDYTPLSTYGYLPTLEQDIGVDTTASVGSAIFTTTTAPTRGDQFRVVYDRRPTLPTADADTIRIEQGIIRWVALAVACEKLSVNQEVGDTTAMASLRQMADQRVQQIEAMASPRQRTRPRIVDAST